MAQQQGISPADLRAAQTTYRRLNDSAMQRKLRREKAHFSAAVWWHPGDCDLKVMGREFRRMRQTGFHTVRFHNAHPLELRPGVYDFARSDAGFDAAAAERLRPAGTSASGTSTMGHEICAAVSISRRTCSAARSSCCVVPTLARQQMPTLRAAKVSAALAGSVRRMLAAEGADSDKLP